ncbi:MAG: aminomethyltransferase family protein [Alphaproteobacteria bacterium]|nr:aminomethyltransferase family protein [Alphaproteobacteria bacterium]
MSDLTARARFATPLHARTAELCTTNLWAEECGFTVPALYTSAREEHEALATRVTLADLSARQCWLIEGADAAAYASVLTTSDAERIAPGETARTLWCDDAGYVRGEGLLARFAATTFELSTAVRDFAWVLDGARSFDVKLVNATGSRAVIGVRGPRAADLLAAAGLLGGDGAGAGKVVRPAWRPAQVSLVRDGEALELWMQADDGAVVWDRLWRAGATLGVAAIGAETLETARIENAAPRAGIDWRPAQLARDASDLRVPADLGFALDLSRRFNGAEALRRLKAPRTRTLVQLTANTAMTPGPVMLRGTTVGAIMSTAWSDARAASVALAWADRDAARPGTKLTAGTTNAEVTRDVFGFA